MKDGRVPQEVKHDVGAREQFLRALFRDWTEEADVENRFTTDPLLEASPVTTVPRDHERNARIPGERLCRIEQAVEPVRYPQGSDVRKDTSTGHLELSPDTITHGRLLAIVEHDAGQHVDMTSTVGVRCSFQAGRRHDHG